MFVFCSVKMRIVNILLSFSFANISYISMERIVTITNTTNNNKYHKISIIMIIVVIVVLKIELMALRTLDKFPITELHPQLWKELLSNSVFFVISALLEI